MVLVYGNSLLVTLVAGSLAQCPELHVAHASTWPEAVWRLGDSFPDVLILDLAETCERHILPLLLANPGLLLIGLDAESNRAVLVSGQEAESLTLDRIQQIVERG